MNNLEDIIAETMEPVRVEFERLRAENAELRESEPKKIKRLKVLIEELKQCNDQLRANLLELETK